MHMEYSFEAILFYLIVLDAVIANIIAWSKFSNSYNKKFGLFSRIFPLTKGWAIYYAVLVFWIGYALARLSII